MGKKIVPLMKNIINNPLKRSMLYSTLCKPIGMIISFLYTPLLLNYLGEESYGIWSTILSVINWINYFDVGIGQGLRNSLARYIASSDEKKARQSVSTGYVVLSCISSVIFIISVVLILATNINAIFNTSINIRSTLIISFFGICVNFILGLSKSQLYATQQAEKVGLMTITTQVINLLGLLALSIFTKKSLIGVATVIALSGIIVNVVFSESIWKRYPYLRPRIIEYRHCELKVICDVGIKFFFIQIVALVLYSTDNMIITQLLGPAYVTPYHTSYTLFGIINGLFAAIISPLWSKYTVAMQNKDYQWIKRVVLFQDKFLPLIGIALLITSILFKCFSKIWLNKELIYDIGLIPCMAVYYFVTVWSSIYSTVLNGIGRINLQLTLGMVSALLNIPLSLFLGDTCNLGTTGVCLATIACMVLMVIPITIDTHRYLNKMCMLMH